MDKNTKMYLGLGVAAVAGYFLYNNWKKKQTTTTTTAPATASIEGPIAGRRMGMVGITGSRVNMDATMKQNAQVKDSAFSWGGTRSFSAQNEVVKDGNWANAGGSIAPNFFKVEDSANSFR